MTTKRITLLSVLFFCAGILSICAQSSHLQTAGERREMADKLRTKLATTKSTQDSISILYDIFDLLPRKEQPEVGREIYAIAERIGDNGIKLNICRLLTGSFQDDKAIAEIEKEVLKIPTSREQKETQLFMRLKRINTTSKDIPEKEKQKAIVRILSEEHAGKNKNNYQRLIDLYTLVEYLRNDEPGELLQIYADELVKLATSEHFNLYAIANIVYTKISSVYSDAEDGDKSIAADRKLLKVIDDLEQEYEKEGRHYRDFEITRYVVYRRMLRNHKWLKPGEYKDLYEKSMALAKLSPDVKADIEQNPRFKAYYYMSDGKYAEAIPYLRKMLDTKLSLPLKRQVLEFLVEASAKAGDKSTQLSALEQLTETLGKLNAIKSAQRYRELGIINDVQQLKDKNAELEKENQEEQILSAKRIMIFVMVGFVLLMITFILALYQWGRYKRNAAHMGEVVDSIHGERQRLRDSLYHDYDQTLDPLFAEESVPGWRQRMQKADIRWDMASAFMTRSIINDLLFIAITGHNDRIKYIGDLSINYILGHVRDARSTKTGETVKIKMPEKDFTITSDFECVTGLLGHIIDTAVEYSPTHTVDVTCTEGEKGYVNFIITTEGIKSAGPDDPQIFENFMSVHRILTRSGSGLFIDRLISFLLKCTLIPDISYKGGARYILRVPSYLPTNPS